MTKKTIKASDVLGDNYYIYELTSSNYTPALNGSITITCTMKDVYGAVAGSKSITLYQNGTSKGAKTTNSSGVATWSITCSTAGIQSFKVGNKTIEVFVDNKSDTGHTHSQYLTSHQSLDSKTVTVEKLATAESGYLSSYAVKQNGVQVGNTINIPKDFLVKSGSVKTVSTANSPVSGYSVGDKYIDLVINVQEGTSTDSHIYILVSDLVDTPVTISDVTGLQSALNEKANSTHTHGNLSSDGKVSTTSNDTFLYFAGIGNSTNSLYKSQYLRADKIKDINAHNNIGSNANDTQDTINTAIDSALDNKIDKGNIQGGVNLLGQWLNYTNVSGGAVVTQQNNVLFHGDEVVRINNSSISDTTKYTDMYWETPYTEFGYNDVFTFSFYAKGTNNAQIKTYFYGESGYITVKRLSSNSTVSGNDTEYSGFNDGNTSFELGSDWQFYTVTYKLNSTGTTTAIKKPVIRVFGGTDCYVSCAKLERGFNATDFNNGTGIKSIKIEATSTRTKDLNNYTKTGFYYNNLNTDCAYISNLPVSNKAFFLTVENWGGSTTYLKQTCTVYSPAETYVRVKNSGTWGAWKKLISVDDASSSKGLADDPYNGLVGTSTKYAREDHAHGKLYHWSTGGVSTATYVDLLEFTMTASWQDIPITFVVRRRAKDRHYYVSIRFSNTDITNSTYTVTSFKVWGEATAQTFYLRKVADNTYRLCAYKTANDTYSLDDMVNFNSGITITKIASANGNYGTTAPSGSAPDLYTSTQIGVPDTDLTWNGVATNNSVSPLTMAMDSEFGANRLAYFPSSRIKVESSTDGGNVWSTANDTVAPYDSENKTKLVTTTSQYMFLGKNSTTDYSKNRLRITIDVGDMNVDSLLYMVTRKIALYTGTGNATGFTCQLQTQTYAQYNTNTGTFSNYGSAFSLGGWSGWNTYPINVTLGGYNASNQTNSSSTRIKAIRLLFSQTGGTGNGFISRIRLYGETAYRTTSQYATNNHIYTINENQDATFPSKIIKEGGTSSQFLMANGDVQNKVTSWNSTPSDSNVTSEKLVKDSLDLKTNISDIKDNLTSTDTNKPLSANQGKVLNETKANKSEVVDWDNITFVSKTDDSSGSIILNFLS